MSRSTSWLLLPRSTGTETLVIALQWSPLCNECPSTNGFPGQTPNRAEMRTTNSGGFENLGEPWANHLYQRQN